MINVYRDTNDSSHKFKHNEEVNLNEMNQSR